VTPAGLRRTLAAAALVVQPVLVVAGQALRPKDSRDGATLLRSVAADPDRWYVAQLLLAVGALAFIGVVIALVRLVPRRGGILVTVGGVLAGAAVTMAGVAFGSEAVLLTTAAGQTADRPTMARLVDRLLTDPRAQLPYDFTLPLLVGVVLLVVGLVRARTVGRRLPIFFAVAFVVSFAPATGVRALALGLPFVGTSWLLARQVHRAGNGDPVGAAAVDGPVQGP
jgi:hypothetical protein